jgi:Tfp pilus assembly protein PilO
MALMPKDQRQQAMLLVVILALAALGLYFVYVYQPAGDELLERSDRLEELETQNRLAEARVGDLQKLRDRLGTTERQLGALQRLVPSRAEVPAIYESIASETQALNIRLLSVEPIEPVPADSAGSLLRQEWLMQVEGPYHAVGELLTRVASFDRIVRPEVTEVVPSGENPAGDQLVTASFDLETFVLGPPGGGPAGSEGEEAP